MNMLLVGEVQHPQSGDIPGARLSSTICAYCQKLELTYFLDLLCMIFHYFLLLKQSVDLHSNDSSVVPRCVVVLCSICMCCFEG